MIDSPADFDPANQPINAISAENDFPIAKVKQIIVGSGHASTNDPRIEAALNQLFQKLVDRFHAAGEVPNIEIIHQSPNKLP